MDKSQINAISLFQEGEYETAIESMAKSTTISSEEYKKFVEQCNHMLSEQYKYLINEALGNRDYIRANSLREEFRQKHGKNAAIEALPIPALKSTKSQTPQPVAQEDNSNKNIRYYIIGGGILLIIVMILIVKGFHSDDSSAYEYVGTDSVAIEEVLIEEVPIEEDEYDYHQPTYEDYQPTPSSSNQYDYSDFE